MKKFLTKKPIKVIISIILVLVVVVCICNAYFASVALEEQKGVAVCDKWSASDTYTADYAQHLEIGDKDAKILCLTDIHQKCKSGFNYCRRRYSSYCLE